MVQTSYTDSYQSKVRTRQESRHKNDNAFENGEFGSNLQARTRMDTSRSRNKSVLPQDSVSMVVSRGGNSNQQHWAPYQNKEAYSVSRTTTNRAQQLATRNLNSQKETFPKGPLSTSSRSIASRVSLRPDTRALQTGTAILGSRISNHSIASDASRPSTSFVPTHMKNTTTSNRTGVNPKRPSQSSYLNRK